MFKTNQETFSNPTSITDKRKKSLYHPTIGAPTLRGGRRVRTEEGEEHKMKMKIKKKKKKGEVEKVALS